MMTEEEKKAIEYLKNRLEILHNNTQWATENSIKVILNLIDKQQKEIEELKENYDELFKKYEMKKVLFVRKDHNTKELLSELYIRKDTLNDDYISKDKIKEKIKELEENYSEFSEYPIGKSIEILRELLEEN